MATLPPSLLSSLSRAETTAYSALATTPLDATPAMRSYANQRLDALVPTSLSTLEELLTTGDAKTRQASALAILDRSPSTKPTTTLPSGPAALFLPPAAITALFEGLGTLLGQALSSPPSSEPAPRVVEAIPLDKELP